MNMKNVRLINVVKACNSTKKTIYYTTLFLVNNPKFDSALACCAMGINGVYPDYATTTDGRSVNVFNINGEEVVLDWNNNSDNTTTEIVNRISAAEAVATIEQYKPTSEEVLNIVTKNLEVIANEYANVTNWNAVFDYFATTNEIPTLDELVNLGINVDDYKNAIVDIVLAEWMSPKMLTKYGFVM